MSVNAQLIITYWGIGKDILDRQEQEGWGAGIIEQLSSDLTNSFPEMCGLRHVIWDLKSFAQTYPDEAILQRSVANCRGHNIALMEKVKDENERLWYIEQTIEMAGHVTY